MAAHHGGGDLLELVAQPPHPPPLPPAPLVANRDRYLAYQGFNRVTNPDPSAITEPIPDREAPEDLWQIRGIYPAVQLTRRGEALSQENARDPNDPPKSRLKLVILEEFQENDDPGKAKIKIQNGQIAIVRPLGRFEAEIEKLKDGFWKTNRRIYAILPRLIGILLLAVALAFIASVVGAFMWDWRLIRPWLTETLDGKFSLLIWKYCCWVQLIQCKIIYPYFSSSYPIYKVKPYGWLDWLKDHGVYFFLFLWLCKRMVTNVLAQRQRRRQRQRRE